MRDADTVTVHLTTATQVENTVYTVTAAAVTDTLGLAVTPGSGDTGTWRSGDLPPTLVSATYVDATHVNFLFSKSLSSTSVGRLRNYSITPGLSGSLAVLDADTRTVHLTTGAQPENTIYTVTVANVRSLLGTPIVPGSGDTASWTTPDQPPVLTSVRYIDPTHLDFLYNKSMYAPSVTRLRNYAFVPALSGRGAVLDADTKTVHMTTAAMPPNTPYTVTVTGARDSLGTPMVVGSGDSAAFTTPAAGARRGQRDLRRLDSREPALQPAPEQGHRGAARQLRGLAQGGSLGGRAGRGHGDGASHDGLADGQYALHGHGDRRSGPGGHSGASHG